jgi:hypothetical protein
LAPAVVAAVILLPRGGATAADNVYTVANYPVEASAENAVTAKERALAEGQQAALRSLFKRLAPVTAFPRVAKLSTARAADLIDGLKVRSERNSSTDYIATLDFSFQAKAVRDLLRREGIPFVDDQAQTVTLIPIWRDAGAPGGGAEAWTGVWRGLDLENSLTPINLQPLRKEIGVDAVDGMAIADPGAIRTFAGAYGTEYLLVAIAQQDPASGNLLVTLSGRDAVGAFVLGRTYRADGGDIAYARELAAVVALRTLEGRWKAIKARSGQAARGEGGGGGVGETDLLINVEFRGMQEWQDISRKLSGTPGVEELEVAGLSARGARVTLRYAQGAQQLAAELGRQGLSMRYSGTGWTLSLR